MVKNAMKGKKNYFRPKVRKVWQQDPLLKDIITKDTFYRTKRGELPDIQFPSVIYTEHHTLHMSIPECGTTDVNTLSHIPSESTCELWLRSLSSGKYKAVSSSLGIFDQSLMQTLLKVHHLRNVSAKVKQEKHWVQTSVSPPNENCQPPSGLMEQFKKLLFQNADGTVVMNKTILASDLGTLTGNSWLNLAVIQGLLDIINNQSTDSRAFILNNLVGLKEEQLQTILKKCHGMPIKYFTFVINVGGSITETYLATPNQRGCHWTMLYIDTRENKWIYCDSLGWAPPEDLKDVVNGILNIFCNVLNLPKKPARGRFLAHKPTTSHGVHRCSERCYVTMPLQTCGSVCGVIVTVLCAISCIGKSVWRNVFLERKTKLPEVMAWLTRPTTYSSYLRQVLIHWLMAGCVDLKLLGITGSEVDKESYNLGKLADDVAPKLIRDNSADVKDKSIRDEVRTDTSDKLTNDDDLANVEKKCKPEEVQTDSDPDSLNRDDDFTGVDVKYVSGEVQLESDSEKLTDDDDLANVEEKCKPEEVQTDSDPDSLNRDDDFTGVDVKYVSGEVQLESDPEKLTDDDDLANVEEKCISEEVEIESDPDSLNSGDDFTNVEDNLSDEVQIKRDPESLTNDDDLANMEEKCIPEEVQIKPQPGNLNGDDFSDIYVDEKVQVEGNRDNLNNGDDFSTTENKYAPDEVQLKSDPDEVYDDDNPHTTHKKIKLDGVLKAKITPDDDENDKKLFYVGQRITNLDEFNKIKKEFEDHNFCELWKKDVRSLKAAEKRVPKRVAAANPALQYYSILLSCKFGGEPRKKTGRVRDTKTFRQGCPFEIYLTLSSDGQALEVTRIKENHNHELTKEVYEHLPRQRALPEDCHKDMADAIKLKANPKLLQQKIRQTTGKKITLKDIANFKQKTKNEINTNDLDSIVSYLKQKQECTTEIIIDEENNFKGIFYQDKYMKSIYSMFPELLLVDATYKLLELRLPVYLLLCVDGDGLSEIVAMFLLAEETKEIIEEAVNIFKKCNPTWNETQVIMSDKDFIEREAFTKCFPGASLNICLYHTLRSLRREITCEKMGITSAERTRCLEIMTNIAYSKSAKAYASHLEALHLVSESVKEYVELNWIPIKEQWVSCFKDDSFNLGETTNNRLESTFNKIKSVCSKYASLMQFFHEFFSVLSSLRRERNHHYLMTLTRKPIEYRDLDHNLKLFFEYLTPYAFNFVRQQFSLASTTKMVTEVDRETFRFVCSSGNDTITTTSSICNCSFMKRMGLPCKHIFKVRSLLGLPLFEKTTVRERWTMAYYKTRTEMNLTAQTTDNHDSNSNLCDVDYEDSNVLLSVTKEKEEKILSQAQKFRKGLQAGQLLASYVSEGGMATFRKRYQLLKDIIKHWQAGAEVSLCLVEKCDNLKSTQPVAAEQDKNDLQEDSDFDVKSKRPGIPEKSVPDIPLHEPYQVNKPLNSQPDNPLKKQSHDHCKSEGKMKYDHIKMPPKMVKRGRPKGSELTVIGIPRCKKHKGETDKIIPFCKLPPGDKARVILECLTSKLAAAEGLGGKRMLNNHDVQSNVHLIPDTIRDHENVDINRVQKYFNEKGWLAVLAVLKKKESGRWFCTICEKAITGAHKSIACDRCLLWYHLSCTSLTKTPKARTWFCKSCKAKYN